jgi:hypothetical protein
VDGVEGLDLGLAMVLVEVVLEEMVVTYRIIIACSYEGRVRVLSGLKLDAGEILKLVASIGEFELSHHCE